MTLTTTYKFSDLREFRKDSWCVRGRLCHVCECWLLAARPFNSSHNKDGGCSAVVVSTDCEDGDGGGRPRRPQLVLPGQQGAPGAVGDGVQAHLARVQGLQQVPRAHRVAWRTQGWTGEDHSSERVGAQEVWLQAVREQGHRRAANPAANQSSC